MGYNLGLQGEKLCKSIEKLDFEGKYLKNHSARRQQKVKIKNVNSFSLDNTRKITVPGDKNSELTTKVRVKACNRTGLL